jgi:hypothetical protein
MGGYFSDNSSYPWKHWRKDQTISAFTFGPAMGSIAASIYMIKDLVYQAFIFERWWMAGSLLLIGLWSLILAGKHFGREDSSEEKVQKQLMREKWDKEHLFSAES